MARETTAIVLTPVPPGRTKPRWRARFALYLGREWHALTAAGWLTTVVRLTTDNVAIATVCRRVA